MRSTFAGLNTMVRGIQNNQLSLDTTGHNITNASTEGYSRQRVDSAATNYQERPSLYGSVYVGGGVDVIALNRARNIYADKQFWSETSTQNLYKTYKTNYDKAEAVFNDAKETGVLNAMQQFYSAWVNLSDYASDAASRTAVITKGNNLVDRIKTGARQLQDQINAQYDEMRIQVGKANNITEKIAVLNQNIMLAENHGGKANDLRDQRDLLVDYTLRIKEAGGIGYVPQGGILKALQDTIVQDKGYIDNLADISATLMTTFNDAHKLGAGIDNASTTWTNFFGRNTFHSDATGNNYTGERYAWHVDPTTGDRWMTATAQSVTRTTSGGTPPTSATVTAVDTTIAADIHEMRSMQIIHALKISDELTAPDGQNLVAARQIVDPVPASPTHANPIGKMLPTVTGGTITYTYSFADMNGTGDGTMAVELSKFFNKDQANTINVAELIGLPTNERQRAVGSVSINQYYNGVMNELGADAENLDKKMKQQDDLMVQINQWRQSTAGVDWNEELTNMLKFQTGYGACSRVLTSMDEMLDKLINGTGMVGR